MAAFFVREMAGPRIDGEVVADYTGYLRRRVEFLLDRFRRFPDFPGVQTGYDSITGREFSEEDLYPYSWINGRGACVFARFADRFPERRDELNAFALHAIRALETHWRVNNRHFPFMANHDGTERNVGSPCPPGFKSYSDLYAGMGFVEYGARRRDPGRARMAQTIFAETYEALQQNRFVTEPDPTPQDRILENPFSVALDLANECVKQLNDPQYLQPAARLVTHLLDRYYLPDKGYYVEYVTPDGVVFEDEEGRHIVDPGHAIEFSSFALEFARLAEGRSEYAGLCRRIEDVAPGLLLWNVRHGWNPQYPGIYKTIDAKTGRPMNSTMPWWILPETLLALILAFERTGDDVFLTAYRDAHNAYFSTYINPITAGGPFQNIDGRTGQPVSIVPACKFQDPEFHSGKNLLTVTEVARRVGLA
jgi:mannose/cellobiose epimerase-like protein (N-acyl-D-glucosamine 2-epimerase family)